VIFLEPKRRYWLKEDLELPVTAPPIGEASCVARDDRDGDRVRTDGDHRAGSRHPRRRRERLDLEVVDVRTLSPVDMDTLVASASKTGRALVVHEAVRFVGYGAEIAAELSERAFGYLAPQCSESPASTSRIVGKRSSVTSCRTPTASSTPWRELLEY